VLADGLAKVFAVAAVDAQVAHQKAGAHLFEVICHAAHLILCCHQPFPLTVRRISNQWLHLISVCVAWQIRDRCPDPITFAKLSEEILHWQFHMNAEVLKYAWHSCRAAPVGRADAAAVLCADGAVAGVAARRLAAECGGGAECPHCLPARGAAHRHRLCLLLGAAQVLGGPQDAHALGLTLKPPAPAIPSSISHKNTFLGPIVVNSLLFKKIATNTNQRFER
jgi:hypothetical protein